MSKSLRSLDPNHPLLETYYQHIADVIAIFWQFHKKRIVEGNVSFACRYGNNGELVPYDPQLTIDERPQDKKQITLLKDYISAIESSFENSLHQFMQLLGAESVSHALKNTFPPDSCRPFICQYVQELVQETQVLGEQVGSIQTDDDFTVDEIITLGARTGTITSAHLSFILQEYFKPILPVLLSKVGRNEPLSQATSEIGLQTNSFGDGNHLLLHPTTGLDMERLREVYTPQTKPSCPASQKPSKETLLFLHEQCGAFPKGTMLHEFSEAVHTDFNTRIMSWFNSLTPELRTAYLYRDEWRALYKITYETMKEGYYARCPHSRER